ncbi:MAG: hypothetical protein AB7V46_09945 [Thermomicrobiales bacterium]
METIHVFIECTGYGTRGPLYTARHESPAGVVLAIGTTEPCFDSARALQAAGYHPRTRIEIWDAIRPYARMTGVIGKWAKLTVSEPDNGNAPQFRTYRPYNAPRGCAVSSRTAISAPAATPATPDTPAPVRKEAA